MQLVVHPADGLPIYRQIMRQITEAIVAGRLKPGDQLASHRDLSEQLVIAPLTVKKAYDELEALGYIATQRGRGTFVCARLPKIDPADRREQLEQAARDFLTQAHLAGLRFSEIVEVLRKTDRELSQKERK